MKVGNCELSSLLGDAYRERDNKDPPSLSRKKWPSTLVDFVSKCLVKNVKERASVRVLMDVSDCEMVEA